MSFSDADGNVRTARTVGVLLAAGIGRRFDANVPGRKLEVLIEGVSVAERALDALVKGTDAAVVAARSLDTDVARAASSVGATVVVPNDAACGMGHSLAAAARFVGDTFPAVKTVVVALGDMPWIRPATIAGLVAASVALDCIVVAVHNGERGHPVVFPARYLSALSACSGDTGARDILRAHASNVRAEEVADSGVLRDIDVPSDVG